MFRIKHIVADGNCLFRALAEALSLPENGHKMLRTVAVNYIRSQRQRFEAYNDTDAPWNTFIENLGREGEWAGERVLVALSELYGVNIFVHTPERMDTPTTFMVDNPLNTIHLLYSNGNHYDLLCEKEIERGIRESQSEDMIMESTTEGTDSDGIQSSDSTNSDSSVETFSDEKTPEGMGFSRTLVEEILFHDCTDDTDSQQKPSPPLSLSDLLSNQLKDESSCHKWLIELGLLSETIVCPKCAFTMKSASPRKGHRIGYFQCSHCGMQQSLYGDTIFSKSHLPLHTFVQILIRWFLNESGRSISREVHVSTTTVTKIKQMMNLFATRCIEKESVRIGGRLRVVEIDEALLHRRKYNVGRGKDPGWVLGGIERPISPKEIPRMFLVVVPNRKRETLQKMILKWVVPGSIIVTDAFKAYKGLSELGFHHYTVNHKKHFVSPQSAAHTQRIEGAWSHVRKEALPLVGCHLHDVGFLLAAYLYRRSKQGDIVAFLSDLKKVSRSQLDEYFIERRKIIPKEQPRQSTPADSSKTEMHKKKVLTVQQKKEKRLHEGDQTRKVLRQSLFTNSTALSQKKHVKNLQQKREAILEKSDPDPTDNHVDFDVIKNSQICLNEIRSSSEEGENPPKTQQSKKPLRRITQSTITTRSQTRKCAGRTPGFYAKQK